MTIRDIRTTCLNFRRGTYIEVTSGASDDSMGDVLYKGAYRDCDPHITDREILTFTFEMDHGSWWMTFIVE